MLSDFTNVRDQVEYLLDKYPVLRDSDHALFLSYLNLFYGLRDCMDKVSYEKLKDMLLNKSIPKFESITRARRKIQEEGRYRGDFYDKRQVEEKEMRGFFRDERTRAS